MFFRLLMKVMMVIKYCKFQSNISNGFKQKWGGTKTIISFSTTNSLVFCCIGTKCNLVQWLVCWLRQIALCVGSKHKSKLAAVIWGFLPWVQLTWTVLSLSPEYTCLQVMVFSIYMVIKTYHKPFQHPLQFSDVYSSILVLVWQPNHPFWNIFCLGPEKLCFILNCNKRKHCIFKMHKHYMVMH